MRRLLAAIVASSTILSGALCAQPAETQTTASTAFEIRGLKGLYWDGIENYYKAVPWMAEHNMNWLMLCYTAWPESAREWRKDYTPKQLSEMKELVTRANDKGITVCLSFNPGIWSNPPLCHSCEDDYQAAWRKVKDAHSIGIYWIALCLDDIAKDIVPADKQKYGTLQEAQVAFVNRMWADMKTLSPPPKMIFCPSAYTTGEMKKHAEYTKVIGEKIDPQIDLFWTGPEVCSPTITVAEAQEAERMFNRQPFVWDNYPVNDMFPWRPLLAPVDGRDPSLAGAVSGILFNPMKQWELNRIPLVSVADYLSNPATYDPAEAVEKTVREFPAKDQPAIRLLLKYYGSSFWGEKNFPPGPRPETPEEAQQVAADLEQLKSLMTSKSSTLQPMWEDVRERVEEDLKQVRLLADGPVIQGRQMKGGAGDLAEKAFGQKLGLVYARPTGKSRIAAVFNLDSATTRAARLRLLARNGDKKKPRVRITANGEKVAEGLLGFSQSDFEAKDFDLPEQSASGNKLEVVIENLETTGSLGQPPWFAVKWVQLLP